MSFGGSRHHEPSRYDYQNANDNSTGNSGDVSYDNGHHRRRVSQEEANAANVLQRMSQSGGGPPATMEPPLTAGSQSQPSQSPVTPLSLGGNFNSNSTSTPNSTAFQTPQQQGSLVQMQAHGQGHFHPQPNSCSFQLPFPADNTHYSSGSFPLPNPYAFPMNSSGHPPSQLPPFNLPHPVPAYWPAPGPVANPYNNNLVYSNYAEHYSQPSSYHPQYVATAPARVAPPPRPLIETTTPPDMAKRKRVLQSSDKENDPVDDDFRPAKKVKKSGGDHFNPYQCFWRSCKNSDEIPPRKAISQFFGRNKGCTQKMPEGVIPVVCRKHYQQMAYRFKNDGRNAQQQAQMVRIAFLNADRFIKDHNWTIAFGKDLGKYTTSLYVSQLPADFSYLAKAVNERSRQPKTKLRVASSPVSSDQTIKSDESGSSKNNSVVDGKRSGKKSEMGQDVIDFALRLQEKGLIGTHKKTNECRVVLEAMRVFSDKNELYNNKLPDVEFLAQCDWPDKPKEPLIRTSEDPIPLTDDISAEETAEKPTKEADPSTVAGAAKKTKIANAEPRPKA